MGSIADNAKWPRPKIVCPRCSQPVATRDRVIYNHPSGPPDDTGHPAPPCTRSGIDYLTEQRREPLPAWFPHREGAGCELTHLLGSHLTGDPKKAGWSGWPYLSDPLHLSHSDYYHVRIPKDPPVLHEEGVITGVVVPDVAVWLRFMIPQLRPVYGNVTDAYRAARALMEDQPWYVVYMDGLRAFYRKLVNTRKEKELG